MDIVKLVANARLHLFANLCDAVNVLNQLHILSDERAERANRFNVHECIDAARRIYGDEAVDKLFESYKD